MADETFELFSLTSRLQMDTAQFDRAYGQSQGKMRTLAGDLKKVESAAKSTGAGLNNELGGALSSVSPKLAALGTAGAAGIAVVGLGAIVAVATSGVKALWELSTSFAETAGHLKDMSAQVNFSVETLSGLSGIVQAAGGDLDQLSAGLTKFQINLAKSDDIFQVLGVTSRENEAALRQTFAALNEVTDATQQSAMAAEVFGAKGGKIMLGLIKEMDGDLDAAMVKLRQWGVIVSTEDAEAADEFGDRLDWLGLRMQGVTRQLASETTPAFTSFFVAIDAALDSNAVSWRAWGQTVATWILSAEAIIGGFAYAVSQIEWANPLAAAKFASDVWTGMNKTADIIVPEYQKRTAPTSGGDPRGGAGLMRRNWTPGGEKKTKKAGKTEAEREAEREAKELKRLTEQRVEMVVNMATEYKRLDDELKGVDTTTRSYAIQERILRGDLKDASPEIQKQATAWALLSDRKEVQIKTTKELLDFQGTLNEALRQAEHGDRSWLDVTNEKIKKIESYNQLIKETAKLEYRLTALRLDSMERLEKAFEWALDESTMRVPELPAQSEAEFARALSEAVNAGMGEPPEADPMWKWRELVEDFSYDITSILDGAIHDGFEDGIGAGIESFGLGVLQMAKHEALKVLQEAIAAAMRGGDAGGQPSGGKGFFSTLLSFGLSALGGMFGGKGGGGGGTNLGGSINLPGFAGFKGKASGGFMYPNSVEWVGERGPELVRAGPQGATVSSYADSKGRNGGSVTNVYVTAKDADSFTHRDTRRKIQRRLWDLQRGY